MSQPVVHNMVYAEPFTLYLNRDQNLNLETEERVAYSFLGPEIVSGIVLQCVLGRPVLVPVQVSVNVSDYIDPGSCSNHCQYQLV